MAEPLYVSDVEVSALTSIPRETLRYWRKRGEGPTWAKFGASVRYPLADLRAWIEARTRRADGVQS